MCRLSQIHPGPDGTLIAVMSMKSSSMIDIMETRWFPAPDVSPFQCRWKTANSQGEDCNRYETDEAPACHGPDPGVPYARLMGTNRPGFYSGPNQETFRGNRISARCQCGR